MVFLFFDFNLSLIAEHIQYYYNKILSYLCTDTRPHITNNNKKKDRPKKITDQIVIQFADFSNESKSFHCVQNVYQVLRTKYKSYKSLVNDDWACFMLHWTFYAPYLPFMLSSFLFQIVFLLLVFSFFFSSCSFIRIIMFFFAAIYLKSINRQFFIRSMAYTNVLLPFLFSHFCLFVQAHHVKTDSAVFRLHTNATVILLVTFSIAVTTRQYVGNPIDCVHTR